MINNKLGDDMLNPNDLIKFTNTKPRYHQGTPKTFFYSDGVEYLAETYGMFWLVSDISIVYLPCVIERYKSKLYHVIIRQLKAHEIELIIVNGKDKDLVIKPIIYRHYYKHANFVFDGCDAEGNKTTEMKLFIRQDNNCSYLMLPTEYLA